VTANCLENQFTFHDLYDKNHKRQVKARVKSLLASTDDTLHGKVGPCDIQKISKFIEIVKGLSQASSKKIIGISDIYLITAFGYPTFQSLGRK
jgi:hypothetical protein